VVGVKILGPLYRLVIDSSQFKLNRLIWGS
jgi:hypothetical protein